MIKDQILKSRNKETILEIMLGNKKGTLCIPIHNVSDDYSNPSVKLFLDTVDQKSTLVNTVALGSKTYIQIKLNP